MHGVYAIRPTFVEISGKVGEIRGESVSIEEDNVVWINSVDCFDTSVVPELKACVSWIGRFVENVVSCDPGVAFIMCCELFPKPNRAILEIFVNPERRDVRGVIGMPVLHAT